MNAKQKFSLTMLVASAAIIILGFLTARSLAFTPALLGLIGFALWPMAQDGPRPISKPALIFAFVTAGLAMTSSLWSIDPSESLTRALKIIGPLLGGALLFGLCSRFDKDTLRQYWWLLPVVVWVCALLQISEYFTNYHIYRFIREIDEETNVRNYELNRPSVILAILAPLMMIMVQNGLALWKNKGKLLWMGLYILPFIALICITEAQSAQLCFVTGMIILLFLPRLKRPFPVIFSLLFCTVLIGLPFAAMTLFSSLPNYNYAEIQKGSSWIHHANVLPRLEIWDYISRYSMQNPLTGFGIEATRMVPKFYSAELYNPGTTILHPHNIILQIWIEFGLIGIGLACAAGSWLLLRLGRFQDRKVHRLALSTFGGLMAVGFVGFGLWQGWWLGLISISSALSAMLILAHRVD